MVGEAELAVLLVGNAVQDPCVRRRTSATRISSTLAPMPGTPTSLFTGAPASYANRAMWPPPGTTVLAILANSGALGTGSGRNRKLCARYSSRERDAAY